MILVDTSVWIDHLRARSERLSVLLQRMEVLVHPFVIGEMALGGWRGRGEVIELLSRMPRAPVASHAEVLTFIEARELSGKGIGYVDTHLLASAFLARALLWTRDKRLHRVAAGFGVT